MKLLWSVVLGLLCATVINAQEKKEEPKLPVIQWPDSPKKKKEEVVKEEPANRLGPGVILDVPCTADVSILVYPYNAVKWTKEILGDNETLKQRGKFVDGSTSKTWKGPLTVLFFEANSVTNGVMVSITPYGFKSDAERIVRIIDVDDGTGKKPPPVVDPVDPVVVDPPVDTQKKASKLTVVICEHPVSRTVEQAKVINDPAFRKFVTDTGGSVQLVSDKDAVYKDNRLNEYGDDVGLPCVLVFDADATGVVKPLTYFKLTDVDPKELIKKLGKVKK